MTWEWTPGLIAPRVGRQHAGDTRAPPSLVEQMKFESALNIRTPCSKSEIMPCSAL